MTQCSKLAAGAAFPGLVWPAVGGGTLDVAAMQGWRLLAVYRGKHCPLCKRYLKTLDGLHDEFRTAGVTVSAVSADPKEKAEADVAEQGWRFPVGYGLTIEHMCKLGLYVSDPRSPQETDRPFAEPGLFLVNPQGSAQIIDVSNAPFARPDLQMILNGVKTIIEKSYPVRGTHA
ncbi:MAG: redoxin domain-containing protein [Hyphomicrobiaceae bacterium]|nr:MAG: redoxin domain-containing protein [Hyphomicrobiaceae bacterium]